MASTSPIELAQFEPLVAVAEQSLSERAGQPIRLKLTEKLDSEHVVLRCQVLDGADRLPASALLKQMPEQSASTGEFPPCQQFLNEWASLRFLSDLHTDCVPQLLASHQAEQLIVLEDLGAGASLQDILFEGDPFEAHQALAACGALLGDVQSSAYRQEQRFRSTQAALGANTPVCDGSIDVRTLLGPLHAMFDALALVPPSDFDRAVAAIVAAMCGESPFRTLQHFDAGPHNVMRTQHSLKLLDFEFAGFGHGLIDVVGARMAFPAAYRGRRVPAASVDALEAKYRAQIAGAIPIADDDAAFASAIGHASAHWALAKLYGFWNGYLQYRLSAGAAYDERDGRKPERAAYFRQMIFTYLLAFAETAADRRGLDALGVAIRQVMDALRREWPDLEPWDVYPAFLAADRSAAKEI